MKTLRSVRTLTSKVMEEYTKKLPEFNTRLSCICSKIHSVIKNNQTVSEETSLTVLCGVKQELLFNFEQYEKVQSEFSSYLSATRTEDSNREIETPTLNDTRLHDMVFSFLQPIELNYQKILESRLQKSIRSKTIQSGSNA